MNKYEKNKLLVRVARLYYESDYSQEQIARQLGLSRPYVSKLLHAAKEAGIVKIQVIDEMNTENGVEKLIREYFGLEKVIVIPSKGDGQELKYVGEAAARFLDSILEDGDIIGTSWGDTIYQVSNSLIGRTDLKNITHVQLCGGISNMNSSVHAAEIANNFSEKLRCTSYLLQLPAIVGNRKLKKMLEQDASTEKILDLGRKSRIAMFTIGAFGERGKRSALVRAGYLDQEQTVRLTERGAVGDICSHVINAEGNICDEELDERTIALSLEDLAKKDFRIGVAQGVSKEESMFGALNSGIINVLITNDKTADAICEKISNKK